MFQTVTPPYLKVLGLSYEELFLKTAAHNDLAVEKGVVWSGRSPER